MVRSGGFYLRDIVEEKCRLRPACRKLPGLSREKTWITPRLSGTSGAQQRKNVDYKAFRNVGYNKCHDAHRGRMFRLLWTFVDLKLPSAMSHAIHKIVSIKRCQSYFISRRSPHLGISKDSESCASAHRCLHYAYARLCFRNFLVNYRLISPSSASSSVVMAKAILVAWSATLSSPDTISEKIMPASGEHSPLVRRSTCFFCSSRSFSST